jgi:hypothetical protein
MCGTSSDGVRGTQPGSWNGGEVTSTVSISRFIRSASPADCGLAVGCRAIMKIISCALLFLLPK